MRTSQRQYVTPLIVALVLTAAAGASVARAQAPARNFLWKVQSSSSVLYIAGSVHALSPDMYPLDPAYQRAFDEAEYLRLDWQSAAPKHGRRGTSVKEAVRPRWETVTPIGAEVANVAYPNTPVLSPIGRGGRLTRIRRPRLGRRLHWLLALALASASASSDRTAADAGNTRNRRTTGNTGSRSSAAPPPHRTG